MLVFILNATLLGAGGVSSSGFGRCAYYFPHFTTSSVSILLNE